MSTSFPTRYLRVRFAGETNVGCKRDHNEDSFFIPDVEPLALVADGMGGHAAGEVASKMAVDTIAEYCRHMAEQPDITWPYYCDRIERRLAERLLTAVRLANQAIWDHWHKGEGGEGMGTTLVGALFFDEKVIIAHVGDSRCYRVRDGQIEQITEDHSLLNDYRRMRELTPEELASFKQKNVMVRALGLKEAVQVDLTFDKPHIDDLYILCSDGLSGMVSDEDMAAIVLAAPDLDKACEKLIAAANANGGVDNITVVLARAEAL